MLVLRTPVRRCSTERWLAHGVVVALLVAVAAARAMISTPASAFPSASIGNAAPTPATPAAATSRPAPVAVPAKPRFDYRVVRWRTISNEATRTVLDTTGVRLDVDLLLALVAVESAGQPGARSTSGSVGLTQVQPATFLDLQTRYRAVLAGQSLELLPNLRAQLDSREVASGRSFYDIDGSTSTCRANRQSRWTRRNWPTNTDGPGTDCTKPGLAIGALACPSLAANLCAALGSPRRPYAE